MTMTGRILAAAAWSAWGAWTSVAYTAAPPAAPAAPGHAYALVIVSQSGGGIYAKRYEDWATRFHGYLTGKAGLPAGHVTVLAGDQDIGAACVEKKGATREDVAAALEKFRARTRPEDQFTLILIGHGTALTDPVTLSLPGPDPDMAEIAKRLDAVPAGKQIVLNFLPGAGNALELLAKPGRVNLSAFSVNERNASLLPEFLLMALETGKADGNGAAHGAGKADGAVTLLEAYHWSVRELVYWFHRQKKNKAEEVVVKGSESVRLFKKLHGGPPINVRSDKSLPVGMMPLSKDSDADSPDGPGELAPPYGAPTESSLFDKKPGGSDLNLFGPEHWGGRRMVSEHALLEDCGVAPGVCALRSWATLDTRLDETAKPPSPDDAWDWINGQSEGSAGYLAGRTVIGRPTLLGE